MKGRSGFGWQTSLADLSLILFMLSAAALHRQPPAKAPPKPTAHSRPSAAVREAPRASARSEPLAVYEAGPDAPSLAAWLAQQAVDPRQQLTITARYGPSPGAREQALREATRLLAEAGAAGRSARLVVEPGDGPARVALAYDTPGDASEGLARDLL